MEEAHRGGLKADRVVYLLFLSCVFTRGSVVHSVSICPLTLRETVGEN